MLNLIKKEFILTLHPTCYIFLTFGFFVFIPNYPYEVMFFFSTLSTFFTCLGVRENKDFLFSCTLPICKKDIVNSRIITTSILQIGLVGVASVAVIIKNCIQVINLPNQAGLDANTALIGIGLIILGLFNAVFFPIYFSNPNKVGKPFIFSSIITFVIVAIDVALFTAVPFLKETIDTPDTEFILPKIIILLVGAIIYALLTALSVFLSQKNLAKVNL